LALPATIIVRGLGLGLFQLALLVFIALSGHPGNFSGVFSLSISALLVFLCTLVIGSLLSGADEFVKSLIIAELVVWPVLIGNAAPTLSSSGLGSGLGGLLYDESFFLGISGFVLLLSMLFGGVVGSFIQMFLGKDEISDDWLEALGELEVRKFTDEELLSKYWALRSKLRSEEDWNEGDRIVVSRVASELSRRGLKTEASSKD